MATKTCRFYVSSGKRCGKKATHMLDEGSLKGSGLCTPHARLQRRYGFRVKELRGGKEK